MIEKLIAKLEQAQGPDRELDAQVWEYLGLAPEYDNSKKPYGNWHYNGDGRYNFRDDTPFGHGARAPQYTSSIDAAMTLVPVDYDWAIFRTNGGVTVHAWCGSREEHFGGTPAIALCIAALKARQYKNPIAT